MAPRSRPRILLASATALVVATMLAGCDTDLHFSRADATAEATSRSMAAAVIDYVGEEATHAGLARSLSHYATGSVGADVTLLVGHEPIHVSAVVSTKPADSQYATCSHHPADGCVLRMVGGNPLQIRWQYRAPGDGPGIVEVTSFRPGVVVTVSFWGPDIIKSPLKSGLPIDESSLEQLASSPVVGFRTVPAFVTEGSELQVWK